MLVWQLQAMLLKTARQTSQRSTADLSTQHGLCCLQRHALAYLVGHVSEDSTGYAALRGLPCCVERSAVLSSAKWPAAAIPKLYLIFNIIKYTF